MPLPFLGVALNVFGAKKAIEAKKDYDSANEIKSEAELNYSNAVSELEVVQDETNKAINKLEAEKQKVIDGTLNRFVSLLKTLEINNDANHVININGKQISINKIDNKTFSLATITVGIAAVACSPVIGAVAATIFSSSAKAAKEDARGFSYACKQAIEALKAQHPLLKKIYNKAKEKQKSLKTINKSFVVVLDEVEKITEEQGFNIKKWNNDAQNKLQELVNTAETVVSIINEPILNSEDELTKRLMFLQEMHNGILSDIEAKYNKN